MGDLAQYLQQPRLRPGLEDDLLVVLEDERPGLLALGQGLFATVDEVAAIAVAAKPALKVGPALLGLIPGVEFLVLAQLLRAVCELALLIVGAMALFQEGSAQFRFLFGLVDLGLGATGLGNGALRRLQLSLPLR